MRGAPSQPTTQPATFRAGDPLVRGLAWPVGRPQVCPGHNVRRQRRAPRVCRADSGADPFGDAGMLLHHSQFALEPRPAAWSGTSALHLIHEIACFAAHLPRLSVASQHLRKPKGISQSKMHAIQLSSPLRRHWRRAEAIPAPGGAPIRAEAAAAAERIRPGADGRLGRDAA